MPPHDHLPTWLRGPLPALPPRLDRHAERWAAAPPRVRLALLAAVAVVTGAAGAVAAGGAAATRPVLVAVTDLAVGTRLEPGAVAVRQWPAELAPPSVLAWPASADDVLALPVAAGTPLTTTHVRGGALGGIAPGDVLVTAPAADAPHVRRGDVVDVVGSAGDAAARRLASGARVVDVVDGALWLAVSRDAALLIADAAAWGHLGFAVHPAGP